MSAQKGQKSLPKASEAADQGDWSEWYESRIAGLEYENDQLKDEIARVLKAPVKTIMKREGKDTMSVMNIARVVLTPEGWYVEVA